MSAANRALSAQPIRPAVNTAAQSSANLRALVRGKSLSADRLELTALLCAVRAKRVRLRGILEFRALENSERFVRLLMNREVHQETDKASRPWASSTLLDAKRGPSKRTVWVVGTVADRLRREMWCREDLVSITRGVEAEATDPSSGSAASVQLRAALSASRIRCPWPPEPSLWCGSILRFRG